MNFSRFSLAAALLLLGLASLASAQNATTPPLQRTGASPLAISEGGSQQVLAGFDFTGDGKQDLLTLGYLDNGNAELLLQIGDNTGAFAPAIAGSELLGLKYLTFDQHALAAGFVFPPNALGGTPRPSVALIAGGQLRVFGVEGAPGGVNFDEKTAPTFADTALKSVVVADVNGDGKADLVVTGIVTVPTSRGGVWVILNSNGVLQAPVELVSPGATAGRIAVGDVNNDSKADIVVVNTDDKAIKVYLAGNAGEFTAAPLTLDPTGGLYADAIPTSVAVGQIRPGGAQEIVVWNSVRDAGFSFKNFTVLEHTGGGNFARHAVRGFSSESGNATRIGDIAIGDLNSDGQPDVVGSDPTGNGSIAVWAIKLDGGGSVSPTASTLTNYATNNWPNIVSLGNVNGDFISGSTPKLDVVVSHDGDGVNHTVDVFLNGGNPLPPGTPSFTTDEWPVFGGQFAATGATASTLTYAVITGTSTKSLILPTGQTMTAKGVVSGIAINGTYTIKMRVTSGTKFSEKTFTFTVNNTAAVTPGAVAWWPGEDAGADVVGGHTALSLTEPAYTAGKVGRAFTFDGVDDFLYASDPVGELNLRGNLTIEGWVRPAADSKGVRTIVAKQDSADLDLTYALQVEATGRLSYVTKRASDKKSFVLTTTKTVPTGTWTHVAVRVRGVEATLFIDGVSSITKSIPLTYLPPSTVTQAVTIGATCTAPTGARANFWKGEIDELTVYRRALEDDEIDLICKVRSTGKDRFDAGQEFSLTFPQPVNGTWRYGFLPAGPANPDNFNQFDVLDETNAIKVWKNDVAGVQPQVTWNSLPFQTTVGTGADELRYAYRQIAQRPGSDGRYSAVRWTAPAAGRYAVAATWKGIRVGGSQAEVQIFHKTTSLHSATLTTQSFGDGLSHTSVITAAAGDTVDFLTHVAGAAAPDFTSLFASVTELPDTEYVPVLTADAPDISSDSPAMAGKEFKFRTTQGDSRQHVGRLSLALQYSATPNDPNSWIDLPNSLLKNTTTSGWTLFTKMLPAGDFAFRVASSLPGEATVYSDPSALINIAAAAVKLEMTSQMIVASDSTGQTTHRGDKITYRFRARNAGSLPGKDVKLRALVPAGTTYLSSKLGGRKMQFGTTGNYEVVWNLGNLAPALAAGAKDYEFTVVVTEPTDAQDQAADNAVPPQPRLNDVGAQIKQQFHLISETGGSPAVVGPLFSTTIVSPLLVTSEILDGADLRPGGILRMDFTVQNKASYNAFLGTLSVRVPTGLVIQNQIDAPVFIDQNGQPGALKDPISKRVLTSKFNPELGELSDRRQYADFDFGSLLPGGKQKMRCTFRIPYDWPDQLDVELTDVKASITRSAKDKVERAISPVTIDVQPAPAGAPKPVLGLIVTQQAAGPLAGEPEVQTVTTNAGLPVPGSAPAAGGMLDRLSNIIRYTVTCYNTGSKPAQYLRITVPQPLLTTYQPGSARIFAVDPNKPPETGAFTRPTADPKVVDGHLLFVFDGGLDGPLGVKPGAILTLYFDVKVVRNLQDGDRITFGGAFATSRDTLQAAFLFRNFVAEVVPPLQKTEFGFTPYPSRFSATTPVVYHDIKFANPGGVQATGVTVRYRIPAGLEYQGLRIIDLVPKIKGKVLPVLTNRPVSEPAVLPATSGQVVVNIGNLEAGRAGKVRFILKPVPGNLPLAGTAGNVDATLRADPIWQGFDSVSGPVTPLNSFAALQLGPADGAFNRSPHLYNDPSVGQTFALVAAPLAAARNSPFGIQYLLAWGNLSDASAGTGTVRFPIPPGTAYQSAGATSNFPIAASDQPTYRAPGFDPAYPNGFVEWSGPLPAHSAKLVVLNVTPNAGTQNVIASNMRVAHAQAPTTYSLPVRTTIVDTNEDFTGVKVLTTFGAAIGGNGASGIGSARVPGTEVAQSAGQATSGSATITISCADYGQVAGNGAIYIPLGGHRALIAGPASALSTTTTDVYINVGNAFGLRAGQIEGLQVDVPGQGLTHVEDLVTASGSLYVAKKIGLFPLGAGNLIRLADTAPVDQASLVGLDHATLVGNDGASALPLGEFVLRTDGFHYIPRAGAESGLITLPDLHLLGDGRLISNGIGGALLPPGGSIRIPTTGGRIVTDNGAGLITDYGAGVIARDGAGLVGLDSSTVIARDGASLVGLDSSTLVGQDGSTLVGQDGSTLVGQDGSTLTTTAAGNLFQGAAQVAPTR